MTIPTIECLCRGCGLLHEFSTDEIVLEPMEEEPGKSMVTNQCCGCGQALVTEDVAETEPPETCG
jgi:hypothetical protein